MLDGKGNKFFKQHSVFNCVIVSKAGRFGGVHKFRTTSAITASQLYGGLLHIMQLTNGILMGLPLQLVVRPLQVNPNTPKGKQSATVYVVHIELIGSDLQAIQDRAMKQAQWALSSAATTMRSTMQYHKLLAAPGTETTVAEIEEIVQEFHPEMEEREPVAMPKAIDEPEQAAVPGPSTETETSEEAPNGDAAEPEREAGVEPEEELTADDHYHKFKEQFAACKTDAEWQPLYLRLCEARAKGVVTEEHGIQLDQLSLAKRKKITKAR